MTRVVEQVRKVACQTTNILLSGETGSGKTRLARLIHELSSNRDQPFLVVNCAALTTTLIESELFGHSKGAFTGADRDRIGKFCEVGSGTLLLDDVDTLPLPAQAKLLRAIDERTYEKVGANRPLQVKARVIAATNRNLEDEVAAGRFRADLFYRLNVLEFHVPPLRERRQEIRSIAEHFLLEFAKRTGRPIPVLTPDVVRAFEVYPWPGNIRELRNVIERCATLCGEDIIDFDTLPHQIRRAAAGEALAARMTNPASPIAQTTLPASVPAAAPPAPHPAANVEVRPQANAPSGYSIPKNASLANARVQAEVDRIVQALRTHDNNRLRAARELGISRVALYKKLHKYGLMDT
jgi:DNA-binding NtrC family response regulator